MINSILSLERLIVVGDRVLIKPKTNPDKTRSGLFLPPGYKEKEEVRSGYVVKCGPGYPIPMPANDSYEPWKAQEDQVNYLPLQVKEGDLAIFLQKGAVEINYNQQKYFIVSQHAILLLERDDLLTD
jgi:chaperonin GroES